MSDTLTDCLLLKTEATFDPAMPAHWLATSSQLLSTSMSLHAVSTARAENQRPLHHIYLHLSDPMALSAQDAVRVQSAWMQISGNAGLVSRLHCAMYLPGASAAEQPKVHYVVETDPEDGWHHEIFRWYDEEHMPGLSQVVGTVLARRYLNLDHSPHSFACYDLIGPQVLGSPPWLAVRGSAWSDICRPHFTNTLRTMFEAIDHPLKLKQLTT